MGAENCKRQRLGGYFGWNGKGDYRGGFSSVIVATSWFDMVGPILGLWDAFKVCCGE